jgi:hypothetical protein
MGKIETGKLYGLIIFVSILNVVIVNGIFSDAIYVNTYTGQMSAEMIAKMLSFKSKYVWVNYLLVPILLFVKTGLIALCFWIGSFISNSKSKFKDYLRLVLLAETVFIVFSFVRTDYCIITIFKR